LTGGAAKQHHLVGRGQCVPHIEDRLELAGTELDLQRAQRQAQGLGGGLVANLGPVSTLGTPDPLGRWTVEGLTTFSFAEDLPASFTLVLDVRHANRAYHKKRFLITAGGREITFLGYKNARQYKFLFEAVPPGTRSLEIRALDYKRSTPEGLFIERFSIESDGYDHCMLCHMF
jgi:hypothetical protein